MRLGRTLVTVTSAIVAVTGLVACTKPLPNVTVLSGSTTVVLSPQTYCFDATHCHFPKSSESVIHAAAGTTLFVDVPREVADHTWSITSGTLAGNALKTFVGDNYSTGAIANTHSARVDVPYGVGTYTLAVRSATGTWVAEVSVHH